MKFHNDILSLVGKTPLVRINKLAKQHKIKGQIFGKMESLNPGYSVKDRIGVSMIDWAENEGVLKKGGTIIEATSGNTGIGLALVAAVRGYKCIFVLTDKVSVEKQRYLKSLGADIVVCPAITTRPPSVYRTKPQIPFTLTNMPIRRIRPHIIVRPAPRFGRTPRARSRTL